MKANLLKLFREMGGSRPLRLNRQVPVFLACLGISALFWLLTTLSGNFSITLTVPVTYVNLPRDKVLTRKLPDRITFDATAYGFDLLAVRILGPGGPIRIDVNKYRNRRLKSGKNYILTNSKSAYIANQIRIKLKVDNIRPDTIFFRFDYRIARKVPVVPDVVLDFRPQYYLQDALRVEPDTVEVSGASSFVRDISSVRTEALRLNDLSETVTVNAGVDTAPLGGNITLSHSRVRITVPVEQFTEASVNVPVETRHLPDTVTAQLFPETATIVFQVGLSRYDQMDASLFRAVVDFSDVNPRESSRLKVVVVRYPGFVRSVRVEPDRVEYIIRK